MSTYTYYVKLPKQNCMNEVLDKVEKDIHSQNIKDSQNPNKQQITSLSNKGHTSCSGSPIHCQRTAVVDFYKTSLNNSTDPDNATYRYLVIAEWCYDIGKTTAQDFLQIRYFTEAPEVFLTHDYYNKEPSEWTEDERNNEEKKYNIEINALQHCVDLTTYFKKFGIDKVYVFEDVAEFVQSVLIDK